LLNLFRDIALGLGVAHTQRIAHRDVKPANIFLSRSAGRVVPRILDLGLAKVMSAATATSDPFADSRFPTDSAFTPAYASPEQWSRRLGATGAWTDVYALATTFVELLAGHHPVRAAEPSDFMAACLNESERPTPRHAEVQVSDAVEAVFERALAVDPRERFRDARAFFQALCAAATSTVEGAQETIASSDSVANVALAAWLRTEEPLGFATESETTAAGSRETSHRFPLATKQLLPLLGLAAVALSVHGERPSANPAERPVSAVPSVSSDVSAAAVPSRSDISRPERSMQLTPDVALASDRRTTRRVQKPRVIRGSDGVSDPANDATQSAIREEVSRPEPGTPAQLAPSAEYELQELLKADAFTRRN